MTLFIKKKNGVCLLFLREERSCVFMQMTTLSSSHRGYTVILNLAVLLFQASEVTTSETGKDK